MNLFRSPRPNKRRWDPASAREQASKRRKLSQGRAAKEQDGQNTDRASAGTNRKVVEVEAKQALDQKHMGTEEVPDEEEIWP